MTGLRIYWPRIWDDACRRGGRIDRDPAKSRRRPCLSRVFSASSEKTTATLDAIVHATSAAHIPSSSPGLLLNSEIHSFRPRTAGKSLSTVAAIPYELPIATRSSIHSWSAIRLLGRPQLQCSARRRQRAQRRCRESRRLCCRLSAGDGG
jgi:hypothetical protein